MTTPTPIAALVARQREQRTTERPGIARLDVPLSALLLEQRHQLCDLDADSQYLMPGATCPACPPKSEETPS